MSNPFCTNILESDQPFCDRNSELQELYSHAHNGMNAVIFAPRRYGKTSLVTRVQDSLKAEGVCVIYAQFMRVVSVRDLVNRLSKAVIKGLHDHSSLLDKGRHVLANFPSLQVGFNFDAMSGQPQLSVNLARTNKDPLVSLEDVLEEVGRFLDKDEFKVNIALDEFQDIVDLREPRVEAILREHIQRHRASYFFLGSRRRVLIDIFNNQGRPFFQSAAMMELPPLPSSETTKFINNQFKEAGKSCPDDVALFLGEQVEQYPYYVQALAYQVFQRCGDEASIEHIRAAYKDVLANERYGFQGMIMGLSAGQLKLLRALAGEPEAKVTSSSFLSRYDLSLGGVQGARRHLQEQDLIEQLDNGSWRVVDPVFRDWLKTVF